RVGEPGRDATVAGGQLQPPGAGRSQGGGTAGLHGAHLGGKAHRVPAVVAGDEVPVHDVSGRLALMHQHKTKWSIFGMTAPAYLWLTVTVLLPLSAMLYFSFLTQVPFGGREAALTLQHYRTFWELDFYRLLTWRSIKLGLHVTGLCLLLG